MITVKALVELLGDNGLVKRFSVDTNLTRKDQSLYEVNREEVRRIIRESFRRETGLFLVGVVFDFECSACFKSDGEHENDCPVKCKPPTLH